MDITEEIREEEAMSGKLKITENKKGGDTIDTEKSEKSKSKKRSEPSLDKLNPKDMKITLPSSKSDDHSLSSMSKFSHEYEKIPRKKKNKDNNRTISHSADQLAIRNYKRWHAIFFWWGFFFKS